MENKKRIHTLAVLALFVATIFWASAYLFVKQVVDVMSPYYLLAFRYIAAAVVIVLIAIPRLKHMTKDLFKSGILMGIALFVEFLTFTVGLKYTTASRSSFIVAGYIIILPFVYMLIRRKVPKKQELLAALICMVGIALILFGGGGSLNKGDIITIFCAISYAFHIVLGGKFAKKYDGILLNVVQITTTAVLATITALFSGNPPEVVTGGQIGSILYLAIGATIIPYLLCLFGQKYVSTTTSGIVLSFESVVATALSIFFLQDRIGVQFVIGGILVIGAFFVSEWEGKKNKIENNNEKGE